MYIPAHSFLMQEAEFQQTGRIETTLYDLISAISAEVELKEESLIAPIAVQLLELGHARFLNGLKSCKAVYN